MTWAAFFQTRQFVPCSVCRERRVLCARRRGCQRGQRQPHGKIMWICLSLCAILFSKAERQIGSCQNEKRSNENVWRKRSEETGSSCASKEKRTYRLLCNSIANEAMCRLQRHGHNIIARGPRTAHMRVNFMHTCFCPFSWCAFCA